MNEYNENLCYIKHHYFLKKDLIIFDYILKKNFTG